MQEWTNPQYASAVDMLMLTRSTAPREPSQRCPGCWGFKARLFIGAAGVRHWIACTTCGESGQRPARPRRR